MIDNIHEWTERDFRPVETPAPVEGKMINPHMLIPDSKKWSDPRFAGGKFYFAVLKNFGLILRARAVFKRASEAEGYAARLKERWGRLYDAAVSSGLE